MYFKHFPYFCRYICIFVLSFIYKSTIVHIIILKSAEIFDGNIRYFQPTSILSKETRPKNLSEKTIKKAVNTPISDHSIECCCGRLERKKIIKQVAMPCNVTIRKVGEKYVRGILKSQPTPEWIQALNNHEKLHTENNLSEKTTDNTRIN